MCLTLFKFLFLIVSSIIGLLLILREFGITKKMSGMMASDFVSSIAGFLFVYIINALILAFLVQGVCAKVIMILIALSPFIIGRLATYQKLHFYSIIQIIIVIISLGYVFFV